MRAESLLSSACSTYLPASDRHSVFVLFFVTFLYHILPFPFHSNTNAVANRPHV